VAPVVRRALVTSGVALLFLLLIGATYQGVATAFERRRFPHPGRLIDVGRHQLHLYCTGSGTPAVVLEAPEATMSAAWALVQASVRRVTRACSYDRAGLGWSEAGDEPFTLDTAASQLHALLTQDTSQCHRQHGAPVSCRDDNGYVHQTDVCLHALSSKTRVAQSSHGVRRSLSATPPCRTTRSFIIA